MTDTPIARLRELHQRTKRILSALPDVTGAEWCKFCKGFWPCDTIAALDALENRLDAATALIRQATNLYDLGTELRAWLAGDPPYCIACYTFQDDDPQHEPDCPWVLGGAALRAYREAAQ